MRFLRGEMDSCRYCYEGSDSEALISCCDCCGSHGFVHFSCLEKAFHRSSPANAFFCSVCGGRFADNVATKLGESGLQKYGRTSSVGGMLLSWHGLTISESGDAQRAVRYCQEGLRTVGSYAGTNSRPYSICLTNLSVVFTQLGQHRQALDVLQKALEVDKQKGSAEGEEQQRYSEAVTRRFSTPGSVLGTPHTRRRDPMQAFPCAQCFQ